MTRAHTHDTLVFAERPYIFFRKGKVYLEYPTCRRYPKELILLLLLADCRGLAIRIVRSNYLKRLFFDDEKAIQVGKDQIVADAYYFVRHYGDIDLLKLLCLLIYL